jgi:glycine cleavage system H lipoate-binding protein
VKPEGKGRLAFGVTQAGVLLVGGFKQLDYIVEPGDEVNKDDEIFTVETYKTVITVTIPIAGKIISINEALKGEGAELLDEGCYEHFLFIIEPHPPIEIEETFLDVEKYINMIKVDDAVYRPEDMPPLPNLEK